MSYTLNSKERNNAFIKFLVFFIVTVTIIVGSIYFDFTIPLKQVENLSNEIESRESDLSKLESFSTRVTDISQLIDSFEQDDKISRLELQIEGKIAALNKEQQLGNKTYNKLNNTIILSLNDRFLLLKSNKKMNVELVRLQKVEDRLAECQRDNETLLRRPSDNE